MPVCNRCNGRTSRDLGELRRRVGEGISHFQMVPRVMDLDLTTGKDGVGYSLDLVNEAEIYILLIGFRCGYVPEDPRNPKEIAIAQMEYERVLERETRCELCVPLSTLLTASWAGWYQP